YLTTAEAAAYLRYQTASAIRTLVNRGRLRPTGRRGTTLLFRREDLDAFVRGVASGSGQLDAHGAGAHGIELERRNEGNPVSGNHENTDGLPRAGARDRPEDRRPKGGKPTL